MLAFSCLADCNSTIGIVYSKNTEFTAADLID